MTAHSTAKKGFTMLTIEKDFTVSCPDLALLGIPQEQLLFFDIETTGFSGEYASVYLIGCIYPEKDSWHMVQFFADSTDAEPELLSAFGGLLSGRRVLVHFNGDRFDIPFLQKRCAAHGVPVGWGDFQLAVEQGSIHVQGDEAVFRHCSFSSHNRIFPVVLFQNSIDFAWV